MAELPTGTPHTTAGYGDWRSKQSEHEEQEMGTGTGSVGETAKYAYENFSPESVDNPHGNTGGWGGMLPMYLGSGLGGCGCGDHGGFSAGVGGAIGGLIGSWLGGHNRGWGGDWGGGGYCGGGTVASVDRLDIKEDVRHEGTTDRQFDLQRDYFQGTATITEQNFGLQRDIFGQTEKLMCQNFGLQKDILQGDCKTELEGLKNTFALMQQLGLNARDAERCCCELKQILLSNKGDLALQLCQEFGLTRAQMQECCCTLQRELAIIACKQDAQAVEIRTLFRENNLLDENRTLRQTIDQDRRFCGLEKQLGSIYSAIQSNGQATRNAAVKQGVDGSIINILNNAALPPALQPVVAALLGQVAQFSTNPLQSELQTTVNL